MRIYPKIYTRHVSNNTMNQNRKTILVDSSNLLHRAVWITQNARRNVSPSYIFLTSIKKYAEKFNCNNIISVWDKRLIRGVKNYRRLAKKAEYKQNRDSEKNAKVFSHEDLTTEFLECLGVKNMYPGILEADDVISWLTKYTPGKKVVVSVDQDMLQLINDDTIVYSPIKDVLIDKNNFEQSIGVPRDEFLRYKSLIGDKSDNLPGVERVGKKTAIKLLQECVTDDQLLEKLGPERLAPYYTNLQMIDLNVGLEKHPDDPILYQEQYDKIQNQEPDFKKLQTMCEEHGIRKINTDIHIWQNVFGKKSLNQTLENIVKGLEQTK